MNGDQPSRAPDLRRSGGETVGESLVRLETAAKTFATREWVYRQIIWIALTLVTAVVGLAAIVARFLF